MVVRAYGRRLIEQVCDLHANQVEPGSGKSWSRRVWTESKDAPREKTIDGLLITGQKILAGASCGLAANQSRVCVLCTRFERFKVMHEPSQGVMHEQHAQVSTLFMAYAWYNALENAILTAKKYTDIRTRSYTRVPGFQLPQVYGAHVRCTARSHRCGCACIAPH